MAADGSVVRARGLRMEYGKGAGLVRAVDGVDLDVADGRDAGGDGAERVREIDAAAPARRPGAAIRRRGVAGRAAHRRLSETALARMRPPWRRLRLPGLPSHGRADRGGERRAAGAAWRQLTASRPTAGRASCWSGSGFPTAPGTCRRRFRAASASESRSPARSQRAAASCSPTSRRAISTVPPPSTCSVCSTTSALAGRRLSIVTHDDRIAATADRLISMRDGAFVEETRLTHGTTRLRLDLAGLEG